MITFEQFFYESVFNPKPNDIWFHGSVGDFDPATVKGNVHKDGLVYLTRDIRHTLNYAQSYNNFGSTAPTTKGFIYAYRIDPSAKIFDATQNKQHWGYTEVMQNPEDRGETVFRLLDQGYDGVLQKQADTDQYGNLTQRSVKRKTWDKWDGKQVYRRKIPFESGFRGNQVLGIKPEFLIPVKKIPLDDAWNGLESDTGSRQENKRIRSDFYKSSKQSDF